LRKDFIIVLSILIIIVSGTLIYSTVYMDPETAYLRNIKVLEDAGYELIDGNGRACNLKIYYTTSFQEFQNMLEG